MNDPESLAIVEGVEKILDLYNACYMDMVRFSLVTDSSFLKDDRRVQGATPYTPTVPILYPS